MAAWCGLRFGELTELRWRDLDLAAGLLRVRWNSESRRPAPGGDLTNEDLDRRTVVPRPGCPALTFVSASLTSVPEGEVPVRFEVNLRDGSRHEIEAAYIEVIDGAVSSSFTLVGPVPGYLTAILAAFPVDMVESVLPALDSPKERPSAGREPR